jgi:hypothetical protein
MPTLQSSAAYLCSVPPPTIFRSERGQLPCFVLFYVEQLLGAWIPQRRIPGILCALVHGYRGCGAVHKSAAVAEGDELGKCIGALRAAEERRVSDLAVGVVLGLRREGAAEGAQGCGRGNWRRHWKICACIAVMRGQKVRAFGGLMEVAAGIGGGLGELFRLGSSAIVDITFKSSRVVFTTASADICHVNYTVGAAIRDIIYHNASCARPERCGPLLRRLLSPEPPYS